MAVDNVISTKEIWFEVHEKLVKELGREPTDEEIQYEFTARMSDLVDQAYERVKNV